jgi:hypothetical protein
VVSATGEELLDDLFARDVRRERLRMNDLRDERLADDAQALQLDLLRRLRRILRLKLGDERDDRFVLGILQAPRPANRHRSRASRRTQRCSTARRGHPASRERSGCTLRGRFGFDDPPPVTGGRSTLRDGVTASVRDSPSLASRRRCSRQRFRNRSAKRSFHVLVKLAQPLGELAVDRPAFDVLPQVAAGTAAVAVDRRW